MANISDVALKAGVSKGTVSKVLKNYPNISKCTRNKVLNIVKELNYIPNESASVLSSKNTNRIGVYVNINDQKQAIDEINMQLLLGSFRAANSLNFQIVTIFNDSVSSLRYEEMLRYLHSLNLAGLIIFGLNKNDKRMHYVINNFKHKIVLIDAPLHNDNISCVYIDHARAQYEVAHELIKDRCGSVLYLAGKKDGYVTDMRNAGIDKFASEVACKIKTINAEFDEVIAYNCVKDIGANYDYIICASDLMAIGAYKALKELNIYRPISGFDGIKLLSYLDADIITVAQDFNYLGYRGVEVLNEMLKGVGGSEIIVPHKLLKSKYQDILK